MSHAERPIENLLIRATNWVGDAVMSLPALRIVRQRFPQAQIALLGRPWVADLYSRERIFDRFIPYSPKPGRGDWGAKWHAARSLKGFDAALLLTNSFESAAVARVAGIPRRIGYARDGRGWLLTDAVERPEPGSIPRFEAFYYLELLRRIGWTERLPEEPLTIRLDGAEEAAKAGFQGLKLLGLEGPVIGVSPGAAYGNAKRYLPERFAEAAATVAKKLGGQVALFGAAAERELCQAVLEKIQAAGIVARNCAGQTTLAEFIDLAAACHLFLTNDSGAMHIASALGVPTVTVFGATNEFATGPTGSLARVLREPGVPCAPCMQRECTVGGHPCMSRVPASRVSEAALTLLAENPGRR